MRSAWRVAKILGIDINIDSSWIVIFVLFTWSLAWAYFPQEYPGWSVPLYWLFGFLTSLVVFVSVLVHELAHSVVAIKNGEEVRSITLFILGGVAQISGEPEKPLKEFSMAVAGPAASFVLAGFFYGLQAALETVSTPLHASARYLALINLVLGIFNLLPGFPMDGGRVLRSIVWKITGNLKKATRIASISGQVMAFLMIFIGIIRFLRSDFGGLWLVLIGWFLHNAAVKGYEQIRIKAALEGLRAGDIMNKEFKTVSPGVIVQDLVDDYMMKSKERVFLVTAGEELRGIVCLEDVKKLPREKWPYTKVEEIMTPRDRMEYVSSLDDGSSILSRLVSRDVHQIPVMEAGRLVGVICRPDVLRVIQLRSELGE